MLLNSPKHVCRVVLNSNLFQISRANYITSKEWREKYHRYRTRLNESPDWSYTDGRGYGPLTPGQKERYLRDQQMAETVVIKLKELKEAKQF